MTHQDRIAELRAALCSPPMTEAERIEQRRLVAKQAARDEQRRNPQPQLELPA